MFFFLNSYFNLLEINQFDDPKKIYLLQLMWPLGLTDVTFYYEKVVLRTWMLLKDIGSLQLRVLIEDIKTVSAGKGKY